MRVWLAIAGFLIASPLFPSCDSSPQCEEEDSHASPSTTYVANDQPSSSEFILIEPKHPQNQQQPKYIRKKQSCRYVEVCECAPVQTDPKCLPKQSFKRRAFPITPRSIIDCAKSDHTTERVLVLEKPKQSYKRRSNYCQKREAALSS